METRVSILGKVITDLCVLKEPLDKVCAQIRKSDQQVISENLVRIIGAPYTRLNGDVKKEREITDREAGRTFWEFGGCVVWIDTSRLSETIERSIAHELAHVFYNHPKAEEEAKAKGEKVERLKAKGEEEAKAKAREWGFDSP